MKGPPLTYRLLAKIPRVTLGGPNKAVRVGWMDTAGELGT